MPNPTETPTSSPIPSSSRDSVPAGDRGFAADVQREQVRLLYEQLPQGVASVVTAAVVTAVLFWQNADPGVAATWLGLVVARASHTSFPGSAGAGGRTPALIRHGTWSCSRLAPRCRQLFGLAPVVFASAGGFESLAMMLTVLAMLGVAGVAALGADFRIYLVFLLPLTTARDRAHVL